MVINTIDDSSFNPNSAFVLENFSNHIGKSRFAPPGTYTTSCDTDMTYINMLKKFKNNENTKTKLEESHVCMDILKKKFIVNTLEEKEKYTFDELIEFKKNNDARATLMKIYGNKKSISEYITENCEKLENIEYIQFNK